MLIKPEGNLLLVGTLVCLPLLAAGDLALPLDCTWTWRVDRLVRLMMLANRRAVWHRYPLGRQQDHKEPRQQTESA
ncbi:hypothetical protein ACEU6F_20335 [Aeromonas salmonicida]|uniref:hypothetical protein n=1 Tax=Aeromonas salmonicida TaxID=645 RepID=UPI00269CA004